MSVQALAHLKMDRRPEFIDAYESLEQAVSSMLGMMWEEPADQPQMPITFCDSDTGSYLGVLHGTKANGPCEGEVTFTAVDGSQRRWFVRYNLDPEGMYESTTVEER